MFDGFKTAMAISGLTGIGFTSLIAIANALSERAPGVSKVEMPLIVLVTAFVMGLLGLGTWVLTLERRKADKADLSTAKSEMEKRIGDLLNQAQADRKEILTEIRDLRGSMRNVEHCHYVEDINRRSQGDPA